MESCLGPVQLPPEHIPTLNQREIRLMATEVIAWRVVRLVGGIATERTKPESELKLAESPRVGLPFSDEDGGAVNKVEL